MYIKTLSNVIALYRRYGNNRMINQYVLKTVTTLDKVIKSDVVTHAHEYDDTVISLYKNFQRNRGNHREKVIQCVTRLTQIAASKQHEFPCDSIPVASKIGYKPSLWERTKALFTFDLSIAWQTTSAFSFIFVFVIVLTSLDRLQNEKNSDILVNIPNYLIEYHEDVTSNIQPNMATHWGFSSASENYQGAFQTGILLVELNLLARLDNQDKLQQVLVEAGVYLQRLNDGKIAEALHELTDKLKLANNVSSRIQFIDEFDMISNQVFTEKNQLPLREFGKWLEINLLSISLYEDGQSIKTGRLLLRAKILAKLTRAMLPENYIVNQLLQNLEDIDEQSVATPSGANKLKNLLKQIKAVMS